MDMNIYDKEYKEYKEYNEYNINDEYSENDEYNDNDECNENVECDKNKIEVDINSNRILKKSDLILLNNGWNDRNEKIIISIGENSISYKWMHDKSCYYNKNSNKCMNIVLIIFNTILSIDTLLTIGITVPIYANDIFVIISKCLLIYIVTLISILQNFLRLEEIAEKHRQAAHSFNVLYHDIQRQMCLYRRERISARKYVSECLKKYDSLIINNPEISNMVIKKFKTTFKNINSTLPEISDKIENIEIITEPKQIKINIQENEQNNNTQINNASNLKQIHNVSNLKQIHNAFQIHGDISDKDLDYIEMKNLKDKFIEQKMNFEYQRFIQNF